MSKQLYLIDQGRVEEIDVSELERITASERYKREWICAYTETRQQAEYCAKLYDHALLDDDNVVIDGETWSVLTLPRISIMPFEDAPRHSDVRGTLYVDRRDGEAWIDYQIEAYVGYSQAEADKQLLSCKLPTDCTVTELEQMLYDLRHLIVAVALSPDRDTAIDRERRLKEAAEYIRNEISASY
jgi:hypothetical protein